MSASRTALTWLLTCGLTAAAPLSAGIWCDVVFKDVAHDAETVVIARVEKTKREPIRLRVVDVLKGAYGKPLLNLTTPELEGLKQDDHVLVALDGDQRPVSTMRSLGFCDPISVLPIRGGKLRARDRVNYDSRSGTLTIDELRDDLSRDLADASKNAQLSGR